MMNKQRAAKSFKAYKIKTAAQRNRSNQMEHFRQSDYPAEPEPLPVAPEPNPGLLEMTINNLPTLYINQPCTVQIVIDNPLNDEDKEKLFHLTFFGLYASFFLLDYPKWPAYIRGYVAANRKRWTFFARPIVMPFIAIFEMALLVYMMLNGDKDRFDVNWKLNANWTRLDVNKNYECWRWFTFLFNGTATQLFLNFFLHVTLGVALEIYNGTMSLVFVHLGYLIMAWLGSRFLVAKQTFFKLPMEEVQSELDLHADNLQVLAWVGIYNMLLANFIFNRRFSSQVCFPVLSIGAWFIISGIFEPLFAPTFGPTSIIIGLTYFASLLTSLSIALFVLPGETRNWRMHFIPYITAFLYWLLLSIVLCVTQNFFEKSVETDWPYPFEVRQ